MFYDRKWDSTYDRHFTFENFSIFYAGPKLFQVHQSGYLLALGPGQNQIVWLMVFSCILYYHGIASRDCFKSCCNIWLTFLKLEIIFRTSRHAKWRACVSFFYIKKRLFSCKIKKLNRFFLQFFEYLTTQARNVSRF